ncbi:MAG: polysaccharide deacetylase family protein [Promethearchaeota archaeon]
MGFIELPLGIFNLDEQLDNDQIIHKTEVYIIYKENSTIIAANQENMEIITRGLNAAQVIQNAINNLTYGGKIIIYGDYFKSTVKPIRIPSNTEIIINGSITFDNNTDDDAIVFANEDPTGGNENITIMGGTIDGNKENQTSGNQTAIEFVNVINSTIDTTIMNFRGYNIKENGRHSGNVIINRLFSNIERLEFSPDDILHNHSYWRILTDFEEEEFLIHEFDEEVAYTADEYWSGNWSLRIKTPLGSTAFAKTTNKKFCFDPRKNHFRARIKIDNPENISNISRAIFICSDYSLYKVHINVRDLKPNEWGEIYFNRWSTEKNPNPQDIVSFGFQFKSKSNTQVTIFIDKLEILEPIFENGLITFTFDDNAISHYTKIFPLMKNYGYKGVEAYCHSFSGMTEAQMKEMQELGWDICVHGWEHLPQNRYTEAEIEQDALRMASCLKSNGFDGYRYYVAPGGYLVYEELMKEYFIFSRRVGGKSTFPPENSIIGCSSIKSETTLNETIDWINDTMERGEWLILLVHGLDGNGYEPWTSDNFSALLSYINEKDLPEKDLPVMNFSEAWKAITDLTSP